MKSLALSIGDPCGIGAEILLKSLTHFKDVDVEFHIFAPPLFMNAQAELFSQETTLHQSNVYIHDEGFESKNLCHVNFEDVGTRAMWSLASLDMALNFVKKNPGSALVTAPLDKSVIRTIQPEFTGHTDYLAAYGGDQHQSIMLLANDEIACALLTHHISLKEVPTVVTEDLIVRTAETLYASLKILFQIPDPSFCITGLNPHAGEISKDSEELLVFKPALNTLRQKGIKIDGPYPADSLYTQARKGTWDVIISPYHDQGLVAIKYPGLHTVVNITCGLPFLRVSPGHGTAYDIAMKGTADERSMIRALRVALQRRIFPI